MPFFYMIKKSKQKFKYLENDKSFYGEIKSIFIIFKRLPIAKNCLRSETVLLRYYHFLLLLSDKVLDIVL